jgi:hypothetical protein
VASLVVAGLMAGWISFENIRNDALKAIGRLKLNWHEEKLTDTTPNLFVHSGLQHPNMADSSCPWNGLATTIVIETTTYSGNYALLLVIQETRLLPKSQKPRLGFLAIP